MAKSWANVEFGREHAVEVLQRFRACSIGKVPLPPDLAIEIESALKLLAGAAASRESRDELLVEAARLIDGTPFHAASKLAQVGKQIQGRRRFDPSRDQVPPEVFELVRRAHETIEVPSTSRGIYKIISARVNAAACRVHGSALDDAPHGDLPLSRNKPG